MSEMVLDGALRFAGARVDLTPPAGSPLAGYGARGDAVSTGAHDPLEAVLLSLRDARPGGERVVWVVLDAVAVDDGLARVIGDAVGAALGCPADRVLVSGTHTHSGPAGWIRRVHPAAEETADQAMRDEVVRSIAAAAAGLAGAERACRVVVADGPALGVGTNRADPTGPQDASVGCLALVDAAGAVGGLLVDHACHATVLGHDNLRWSADWPGAARRTIAAALAGRAPFGAGADAGAPSPAASTPPVGIGSAPVVAILQGAAGDVSPRFTRRAQSFAEVDRLGGLLAAHALHALLAARPDPEPHPRLVVRHAVCTLPTRALPSPADARRLADQAEAAWRAVAASEGPGPQERIARTRHEGAVLLAEAAARGLPPTLELPLTVVALGDDAWLHLPVELFASLGLAIRSASPFARTRVVGYTGAYCGYVADEAAHEAGAYEAAASLFDAVAGARLVEASVDLLRRTWSASRAGAGPAAGEAVVPAPRSQAPA